MQHTQEAITPPQTGSALLSFISDAARHDGMSAAFWRLPDEQVTHCLVAGDWQHVAPAAPFEDFPAGFLFAPFDPGANRIFIPRQFSFSIEGGKLQPPASAAETSGHEWLRNASPARHGSRPPATVPVSDALEEKARYLDLISNSLRAIEAGTFEKVVPARSKTIALGNGFDEALTYQNLCQAYPAALVSWVQVPGIGSWMGASPELLVSVSQNTLFRTVALAATQPRLNQENMKSVAWTQKEIEEQALVERYVISCFKKIRLREYEEFGPKTVTAGNLLHLKTDFLVDMKATNFPLLGSVMLKLLHPTSAVCGMPLEPALAFLSANEHHQREFYAGYLGPVNIGGESQLFVNLRCMQIHHGYAQLYAGAGITLDSIPEKEWEETEMKLNTLSNVLL